MPADSRKSKAQPRLGRCACGLVQAGDSSTGCVGKALGNASAVRTIALFSGVCPVETLLPDTEAAEDLTEQIVAREFAGDARKRVMRKAQFLGKKLPARLFLRRAPKVFLCKPQGAQVALAREIHRLAGRRPAGAIEDRRAQL